MSVERKNRPSALRDILAFPSDITQIRLSKDFQTELTRFNRAGNNNFIIVVLLVLKYLAINSP